MADSAAMGPTISVIVPIYNVEPYLAQCLNSIARQSYSQLQVVMVDDGSTDGSAGIAEEFAARDDRFRLVRQENRGLGGARNTGIDHATGEFLAFVDSDDLLPREAYALLHASIEKSGSDLVTGVVRRFASFGTWRTKLTPFRRTVRRTHIRDHDDLLMDRIVTNKLWRRSFWDAKAFRFPEDVLYEDVIIAFRAQVAAEAVDVLRDTVYWWRQRDASITQRRAVPHGVRDRVEAVSQVGKLMAATGMPAVKRRYERVVLTTELDQFLDVADEGTAEYRQALAEYIPPYLAQIDPTVLDDLPAILRLKYHLTARGLTDELLDVLVFERLELQDAPSVGQDEQRFGVYPYFEDPVVQVPRDVYRLRTELAPRCAIHQLRWSGRKMKLRGYAYIDYVDAPKVGAIETILVIRNRETGRESRIPTRPVVDDEATRRAGQGAHRYDGAGFTATVDVSALDLPPGVDVVLDVEAVVRCGGVERRGVTWERTQGRVERIGRASLRDGRHVRAEFELDHLKLHIERVEAVATVLHHDGDEFLIRGYLGEHVPTPKSLAVHRRVGASYWPNVRTFHDHGSGRREFRSKMTQAKLGERSDEARALGEDDEPLEDGFDADMSWSVWLRYENDARAPVLVDAAVPVSGVVHTDREFILHRTRRGHLGLVENRLRPVVTRARWRGATLVLSGQQAVEGTNLRLVLQRRSTGHERTVAATIEGADVTFTMPLDAMDDAGTPRPLPSGIWVLHVEQGEDSPTRLPLRAHVDAIDRLESSKVHRGRRYALQDVNYGGLAVEVSSASPQPRWRQLHHHQRSQELATRPARSDVVVFNSWHGRRFAGDVRAIYEALSRRGGMKPVWICHDSQFEVDDGSVVAFGSEAHVDALSRAGWVVTDHLLPSWWQPRRGQRVVQTWHGTPVRRAALDLPEDMARAAARLLSELRRQAAAWDILVSASPAATSLLRRTTGFDGEVLEAGAPRCDIHHRDQERRTREADVRRRLGLNPGTRVVLWAPAARDAGWTGRRKQTLGVELHLRDAPDVLGEDVVVLVHRHPAVARPPMDLSGTMVDVTGVHDVADLFLVTDVLISDYSSVVLDFLHTGKPVVLYVPDLDEFVTTGPGFAVDLREKPPGPLARSSADAVAEVAKALLGGGHGPGYDRLLDQYGGPRDGGVAMRVVQQVFDA